MPVGKGDRKDHAGGYAFTVEIDGITAGNFKEVGGLSSKITVIKFSDGEDGMINHYRPGPVEFEPIKLTRGYIDTPDLWNWYKALMAGDNTRKSGSIIVKNNDGSELARYNFFEGWISEWKGFELKGSAGETMVEQITITHERLEKA